MNYPTAIVAAGGLALALVAVPVQFESGDLMRSKSIALAVKGGIPNGGNAGGGGGNGPSTGDDNPGGGEAFGAGGNTSHIFGNPAIASRLKGLNAAHASPDAFANAASNSRVGLLAAYLGIATTPQDLAELTALRDAAQAALDADPGNALLIAALAAAQADLDAALADIDADDLAAAQAVVTAQVALSADPDNAALQQALADAQDLLAIALADNEADALLAATKGNDIDTTDSDVIDRVRALLGL